MARLRRRLSGLIGLSIAAAGLGTAHAIAQSLEFPVKANYLVRFAAFVAWPAEAFQSEADPLTICVAGSDPFGAELDKASLGQRAHNRSITVRKLGGGAPDACHILYLGKGAAVTATAMQSLEARPTLVVTDEVNGAAQGAIHFVVQGNRVRFRVNQGQVPTGMAIDSRLLTQALSVRSGA